mmetsp:Transcript_6583/g.12678  ORF Transcript_6583/g.12678 Transcript_6583/m.12678 type:complete len:233 (+) Transcript_6583:1069-1767(+)
MWLISKDSLLVGLASKFLFGTLMALPLGWRLRVGAPPGPLGPEAAPPPPAGLKGRGAGLGLGLRTAFGFGATAAICVYHLYSSILPAVSLRGKKVPTTLNLPKSFRPTPATLWPVPSALGANFSATWRSFTFLEPDFCFILNQPVYQSESWGKALGGPPGALGVASLSAAPPSSFPPSSVASSPPLPTSLASRRISKALLSLASPQSDLLAAHSPAATWPPARGSYVTFAWR